VAPFVAGAVDHRGGRRRALGGERDRVGPVPPGPVRTVHLVLVALPDPRPGDVTVPHPVLTRLQRHPVVGSPPGELADHPHLVRVRGPDREPGARLVGVRAEPGPDPAVRAGDARRLAVHGAAPSPVSSRLPSGTTTGRRSPPGGRSACKAASRPAVAYDSAARAAICAQPYRWLTMVRARQIGRAHV